MIDTNSVHFILSGGGARGFAHLGVVKAFQEIGIQPASYSGTSAGALAGALLAAGYSPDYLLEFILKQGLSNYLRFAFNRMGLFSMEKVEQILKELIPHNRFEHLATPLYVCATNLSKGHAVYFHEGELIKPIVASCCLPGIFEPISIQGKTYVDGGVLNNLPVEPVLDKPGLKIAVNVTPRVDHLPIKTAKDVLMKTFYLSISQQSEKQAQKCDWVIEPKEIIHFEGLSLKNAREVFALGYQYGIRYRDQIVHLVDNPV